MTFNEINSVEYFVFHHLSGINLNTQNLEIYGSQWRYKSASELNRGVNEVLLEEELRSALIRLNPEIGQRNELADEVIYKLRTILLSVGQMGLKKRQTNNLNLR